MGGWATRQRPRTQMGRLNNVTHTSKLANVRWSNPEPRGQAGIGPVPLGRQPLRLIERSIAHRISKKAGSFKRNENIPTPIVVIAKEFDRN